MRIKGFLTFILVFLMLFNLCACGNYGDTSSLLNDNSDAEDISSVLSQTEDDTSKTEQTTSKDKDTNSKNTNSKHNTTSKQTPTSSKESIVTSQDQTEDIEMELTEREIILSGQDPDLYRFGLELEGNASRIANLMKKAKNGGSYTIGILGGSISGGAGASSAENKYASLVFEWWKKTFPKAKFTLVNASIGSANPEMACYRLDVDLLKYKPDFVIIDFAVNTYLDKKPETTYANLLYRILTQSKQPGILAINFTAVTPKSYSDWTFKKLDEYPDYRLIEPLRKYQIPTVSYSNYIWKALVKTDEFGGEIINWKDIAADYIHPNNNGHKIAASLIIAHLEKIKNKLSSISSTVPSVQKLENEKYLNVKYLTNTTKGVTKTGGVEVGANDHPSRRGWTFNASKAGKLTVPLSKHSEVLLFMSFSSDAAGSIKVNGANGTEQPILFELAKTPTLVNVLEMGNSITIDSSGLTSGSCTIYGICLNP